MPLNLGPLANLSALPASDAPAEFQAGVIPYARVKNELTYLLVTSRGTGKWLFPKGAMTPGLTPREVAIREAREEAGIAGTIAQNAIGTYRDWKTRDAVRHAIEVALFPMHVETQFDDWRESAQRYRHWVTFPELQALLTNPGLVSLVGSLNKALRESPDHNAA